MFEIWIQLFRAKLSEKNVHATIPNGNMGYEQYTVPDDSSCRTYSVLLLSFSTRKHISMASRASLSNFLWRTVNSKPLTIPIGVVACAFSDNLSRNSCIHNRQTNKQVFFSLEFVNILLQIEAKAVKMRVHFFNSAVIANSKIGY